MSKSRSKHQDDESRNVVHPPKFYGEPGEDVEKWFKSFDRAARANGWSNKRQIDILPAFLRDRAADFWDELPIETQNDLELMRESFTNHYMPKEARRLFYSDLYTRKQRENESANDFGREIQQLVRKAYADMPVNHQDTLMREHFINGLRPSLRRLVLIGDPSKFEDALTIARREEIHDELAHGSAPWVKPNQAGYEVPVAANEAETKVEQRLDRLENMFERFMAMSVQSQNQNQNQIRNKPTNRQFNRDQRSSDGRPICGFCSKVGHKEANCYAKHGRKNSKN